ncbi:MAG: permease, partial [Microthrixaceae bacterium]|nr:permease [Microthrixaceae bacterium]
MVNEVAIVMLYGLFGWKVTALYIGTGLVIATLAGWTIGRLGLERWVEPFVFETKLHGKVIDPSQGLTWDDRLAMGREEVTSILAKIWPFLLVGIGVGAAIHGWVPEAWFAENAVGPAGVPVAVGLGVPLYSNAAGVMPLVEALHDKGMPMGTVLAFMMSVVALSLPETILLRRVLQPKLIATFVAVVATGIVATGYLFNAIL